jgi:hypothetical protein
MAGCSLWLEPDGGAVLGDRLVHAVLGLQDDAQIVVCVSVMAIQSQRVL